MCIVDTYILEYDGLVYVELYTIYVHLRIKLFCIGFPAYGWLDLA